MNQIWNSFRAMFSYSVLIIIGSSVDHVVRLANSYLENLFEIRNERLSFARVISVVSGTIATFSICAAFGPQRNRRDIKNMLRCVVVEKRRKLKIMIIMRTCFHHIQYCSMYQHN